MLNAVCNRSTIKLQCTYSREPDATTSQSLASVKSSLVLPFWYRPTRVVIEKGPLNVYVRVTESCILLKISFQSFFMIYHHSPCCVDIQSKFQSQQRVIILYYANRQQHSNKQEKHTKEKSTKHTKYHSKVKLKAHCENQCPYTVLPRTS